MSVVRDSAAGPGALFEVVRGGGPAGRGNPSGSASPPNAAFGQIFSSGFGGGGVTAPSGDLLGTNATPPHLDAAQPPLPLAAPSSPPGDPPAVVSAKGEAAGVGNAAGVGASTASATGRATLSTSSRLTVDATVVRVATADIGAIARRISQSPIGLRDAARAFSQAFAAEAEAFQKINDRSDGHERLMDFFEKMAAGLAELADALDQAIERGSPNGQIEPIFLGTAGKVVRTLQVWSTEWLEENRSLVVGVPDKDRPVRRRCRLSAYDRCR